MDLKCTETRLFKMNPKHSPLHTRGKTRAHELQGHHGSTVVTYGVASCSLFLSHGRGNLGGPVVSQMKVKCRVKILAA